MYAKSRGGMVERRLVEYRNRLGWLDLDPVLRLTFDTFRVGPRYESCIQ